MNSPFADPDLASRAQDRIKRQTGVDPQPLLEGCFNSTAHPEQALLNLEKLLGAMANPSLGLEHMLSQPGMAELLIRLLGASHQIGQVLVQNPELATLILDPSELARPITLEGQIRRGRNLLVSADSYAHRLDRLRFLKQMAMVRCAANELIGFWPAEQVWKALSDAADAVLILTREVVWGDFAAQRGLGEECPIIIIGFGKLGGRELNYSSDIDLVFALDDDASETLEREAKRACEKLIRALTDEMGRGRLYRVDMRLRPFGSSGALASRFRALESYMERYAEPWEHMALIRSRPIGASMETEVRWQKLRDRVAFRRMRGAWAIESILAMKSRTEESSSDLDIKRGVGGIRDAEFAVQLRQLLLGHQDEELRQPSTFGALERLVALGFCEPEEVQVLREGLIFLRRIEHLLQIDGDQQVHELPEDDARLHRLARLMNLSTAQELIDEINAHRGRIREAYERLSQSLVSNGESQIRDQALIRLEPFAELAAEWFDVLAESSEFYRGLIENESSAERVRTVLAEGPMLVAHLRNSVSMTEQLMSGEVLEHFDPIERLRVASPGGLGELAASLNRGRLRVALQWLLEKSPRFEPIWSQQVSEAIRLAALGKGNIQVGFLGSLAIGEMGWHSDADIILVSEDANRKVAEVETREVVSTLREARQKGWPFEVDLRLRPEGRSGPLLFTKSQFEVYVKTRIEPWEVMALRFLRPAQEGELQDIQAPSFVHDPSWRRELLRIKSRVELERAVPGDLKLGPGGLDDIQWLLGFGLLAEPEIHVDGKGIEGLFEALLSTGHLGREQADELLVAWKRLKAVRLHLDLLGLDSRTLPAEPAKLELLSNVMKEESGAKLAQALADQAKRVRQVFEERRDAFSR